jgi:hypothetical protein
MNGHHDVRILDADANEKGVSPQIPGQRPGSSEQPETAVSRYPMSASAPNLPSEILKPVTGAIGFVGRSDSRSLRTTASNRRVDGDATSTSHSLIRKCKTPKLLSDSDGSQPVNGPTGRGQRLIENELKEG